MTAGLGDGWDLATYALGFLLGAAPVALVLAVTVFGCRPAWDVIRHRATTLRIQRRVRRSGRGITVR